MSSEGRATPAAPRARFGRAPSALLGLVGQDIGSSRTPEMHMREAEAQGLRCVYRLIDTVPLGLGAADLPALLALSRSVWRTRALGDFWGYMLVAEGRLDIAAEHDLKVYDMAALVPIVTEAGGRFSGLDGRDGPFSGSALATNGLLHERALSLLAAPRAQRG